MANTLNIPETTLVLLTDALQAHNLLTGRTNGPLSPLTVRVTGHADDDGAATDDAEKMALFTSKEFGAPWIKQANVLETVIFKADGTNAPATCPANVSCAMPSFDYTAWA